MRHKALILLVLAVAVIGGAWWRQTPALPEPVYKGERLSAWLHGKWWVSRDPAQLTREDFKAMGPDAVNWLAWAAEHGSGARRSAQPIHELWRKLFLQRFDEDYDERTQALWALQTLGPDAAPAIPSLTRLLADPGHQYVIEAVRALAEIGPAALPVMESSLQGADKDLPFEFIAAVLRPKVVADPQVSEVVTGQFLDFLVKASADPDLGVRVTALYELSGINQAFPGSRVTDTVLPIFIARLSDSSWRVRKAAADGLRKFGPKAAASIPGLIELLDNQPARMRISAVQALGDIDRVEMHSKARLQKMTVEPDYMIQRAAKDALRRLEPPAPQ